MVNIRWSSHAYADLQQMRDYWIERNPTYLVALISSIRARVNWLADGNYLAGSSIDGLPEHYRCSLERASGYKVFYRLEGDPPDLLSVITIRHGRQRPLRPSTLKKFIR